jgi:hypothetical protein
MPQPEPLKHCYWACGINHPWERPTCPACLAEWLAERSVEEQKQDPLPGEDK